MNRLFFKYVLLCSFAPFFLSCRSKPPQNAISDASPQKKEILSDGRKRSYWISIPPTCRTSKDCPMVFAFHGGGGEGRDMDQRLQLSKEANIRKMILVLPNGVDKNWNDGRPEINADIDDVAFVEQILRDLAPLRSPQTPVFLLGLSNGGQFVFRLACERRRTQAFQAFATVVSNFGEDLAKRCQPFSPLSGFVIFGDQDPIMPFHGGPIKGPLGLKDRGRVISADDTANLWLRLNRCQNWSSPEILDQKPDDETSVRKTEAVNCAPGVIFQKWVIHGGGHGFPGATGSLPRRFVGTISHEFSATSEIFNFFQRTSP